MFLLGAQSKKKTLSGMSKAVLTSVRNAIPALILQGVWMKRTVDDVFEGEAVTENVFSDHEDHKQDIIEDEVVDVIDDQGLNEDDFQGKTRLYWDRTLMKKNPE